METMTFTVNDLTWEVGIQITGPTDQDCGTDLFLKAILALIDQADLDSMAEAGYRDYSYKFNVAILKQLINRSFSDTLHKVPEDLDYAEAIIHDIHHYREEGLI